MEIAGINTDFYQCSSCICATCLRGGIHPQSDHSCAKCISSNCQNHTKTACSNFKTPEHVNMINAGGYHR